MTNDHNKPIDRDGGSPTQKRHWWQRKRYIALLVIFVVLPVALVARHIPKYLDNHPEQDQCEFGTGSTALYGRLRAEAEAYLDEHGYARFQGYTVEIAQVFAKEIEVQLQDFAMSRPTATERWAAIHALLRAYGMDFEGNGPQDERLALRKVRLSARYILLLPKYKWNCPLCYLFPEAGFGLYLVPREGGIYDQIRAVVNIRNLNPMVAPVYYARRHQICPKVLN